MLEVSWVKTVFRWSMIAGRWLRKVWKQKLLDLALALIAVITVAMAGLVIEDIYPRKGNGGLSPLPEWSGSTAGRWVFLVISMILMWALLLWRFQIRKSAGTLYIVRALKDNQSDEHVKTLEDHFGKGGFLDIRTLTRRLLTSAPDADSDWSETLSELALAFEREQNDDVMDSGFVLAPNLLWPAAFSLGHDLDLWNDIKLGEAIGQNAANAIRDTKVLSWRLTGHRALSQRLRRLCDRPEIIVESLRDDSQHPIRKVLVSSHLVAAPPQAGPPGEFDKRYYIGVPTGGQDSNAQASTGSSVAPLKRCRVIAPGFWEWINLIIKSLWAQARGTESSDAIPRVHALDAAEVTAQAIAQALHENPDAQIWVTMRVPKTVALASGWFFADRGRLPEARRQPHEEDARFCPSCNHPWRRLSAAHFDDETGQFQQVRAHRLQPPITGSQVVAAHENLLPHEADRLVNLTPHDVKLWANGSLIDVVTRSGTVVRVPETESKAEPLRTPSATWPVTKVSQEASLSELPDPQVGMAYVVSRIAAREATDRPDVFFPYPEVRDEDSGSIEGCGGLGTFFEPDSTG